MANLSLIWTSCTPRESLLIIVTVQPLLLIFLGKEQCLILRICLFSSKILTFVDQKLFLWIRILEILMAISPFKMRKNPKGISSWKEFFLVNTTILSFEVVTGMQRNNIRRLGAHRCETPAMNKEQGYSVIVSKSENGNCQHGEINDGVLMTMTV